MARSRRIGRSRVTLALLVLVSILFITLDFRDTAPVQTLRSGASTVFSPLQSAGDTVATPFRNVWHGATDYDRVKRQTDRLRRQVDQAKGDRIKVKTLEKDNERLRQAAGIKFNGAVPMVGAKVISGPLSNFDHSIDIDVGSGDGIKVGMAVVTNAGLVGKVVRVYGGRSVVQLMTDPDFRMGVRLTATQDVAVAHGSGQRQPLVIDGGIPASRDIPKGEPVETSGIDRSAFPSQVPVGTVISSRQSQDASEKSVTIVPSADFGALSYVEVMLYAPPS